jgi:hypothetical protein
VVLIYWFFFAFQFNEKRKAGYLKTHASGVQHQLKDAAVSTTKTKKT